MEDQDTKSLVDFRIARLEKDLQRLEGRCCDLEDELGQSNLTIAKLSERVTLFQAFQAVFSSILSAIAVGVSKL